MKLTSTGLRSLAYRIHQAVGEALPGLLRIDGSVVIGPRGIGVAGFQTGKDLDEFGGGLISTRQISISVSKELLAETSLPKHGGLVEVQIGDSGTWRRFKVDRIEGRGSVQQSWVIKGRQTE